MNMYGTRIIYIISTIFLFWSDLQLVSTYSYNPYCWINECCNQDSIPGNITKLKLTLKERVYGQHLVDTVADAIAAHLNPRVKPTKALALSFHGWAGSGKNYVSKFVAESLYKLGTKSKYVHHFIGRIHFSLEGSVSQYKQNLYSWLKGNITNCARQLFIFDEVDKMPPEVLNAIKPMIDHRDVVDGMDYTQAIFIFLSNTGSELINDHYEEYWNKGGQRERLRLSDFENLIAKGAFSEKGGFHLCDAIKSNLIDHYVPFLPMQEDHIIACIKDQFKERHVYNPKQNHIKEVLDFIEWGPSSIKLFSKTGCKRISSKVGLMVAKYYPQVFKTEL